MSMLTPCPECRRHVRKTETHCPFCEAAVSLAHVPAPVLPQKRLGRAATFAFGASVIGATALVACTDGDDQLGAMAVYGAPPGGSSFAGSAPSAGSNDPGGGDGGAAYAVYGSPAAGAGFGGEYPGPVGGTAGTSGVGGGAGGTSGAAGAGGAGGAGGEGGDITDGGGLAVYGGPPSGTGGI